MSLSQQRTTRASLALGVFVGMFALVGCFADAGSTAAVATPAPAPAAEAAPTAVAGAAVAPTASAAAAAPAIATTATPGLALPTAPMKPYRTFINIQRYSIDNAGDPKNPISNVRLELTFPSGNKLALPEGGQYWPIGNGQVQEINRTFELPYAYIQKDGFRLVIQIYRKGSSFVPCQFDIAQLSQYNRSYVCHTDVNWQQQKQVPPDMLDKQGVQLRIFTDVNSKPNEIPTESIALR